MLNSYYKKKANNKSNSAKTKSFFAGGTVPEINSAGRTAKRKSERRSSVKQVIGESVKKSFKAGKAKGSSVSSGSISNRSSMIMNKNNPISKGAAAVGRSYKRAGNTMSALKKAALKKAQQASAVARKGKKMITGR
jgi:hypothetical protein